MFMQTNPSCYWISKLSCLLILCGSMMDAFVCGLWLFIYFLAPLSTPGLISFHLRGKTVFFISPSWFLLPSALSPFPLRVINKSYSCSGVCVCLCVCSCFFEPKDFPSTAFTFCSLKSVNVSKRNTSRSINKVIYWLQTKFWNTEWILNPMI